MFRFSSKALRFPIIVLFIFLGIYSVDSKALSQGTIGSNLTISAPLTVSTSGELEFGYLLSGETGGTVTITTANQRIVTGGVRAYQHDYHRADFLVRGLAGLSYTIAVSAALEFHHSGFGPHDPIPPGLRIINLTVLSVTAGVEGLTGIIGPGGTDIVYVGGTLDVPANVPKGEFEGEVSMTVNY